MGVAVFDHYQYHDYNISIPPDLSPLSVSLFSALVSRFHSFWLPTLRDRGSGVGCHRCGGSRIPIVEASAVVRVSEIPGRNFGKFSASVWKKRR